ncbi:cytochrome P450 [Leucobacter tardus]|uniref:Cytochrome P450 n=1 Tax=Leucobacter tardus TaxID=501483 RepID=A0A939QC29_9MICO|nr:cytochrome P450 [Leucobacter tardus]MBO2989032.1 cytochrome P450 [Leucobacter tardus]
MTATPRAMPAPPVHDAPVIDIDPFSEAFLADPMPYHERLRETAAVTILQPYGVYAVARYDDVHRALTDWQGLQSAAGVGLANFTHEEPWRAPSVLLEADPPRHDAPRAVLQRLLSPRRLQTFAAQWRADADAIVDDLLTHGREFDAVTDLAEVFPLRVFPDAVGLGEDGREHLLPYGDFAFNAFGPQNRLVTEAQQRIGPSVTWVGEQCRRDRLAAGSIGAQIWEAADRGDITQEQAPLVVRSLLTAGVDTTVTGIAAVLRAMADRPEDWRRVREDRSLLPRVFEEAVRLESPVQTFFRTTTAPVEIAGVPIPAGEKVLMFLGAANRDRRRWSDPHVFDLDRDPSGHVAFGMGLHQCVGQHIARLEAVSVLDALLDRVVALESAGPERRHLNNTLRGFESLPMRWTAA